MRCPRAASHPTPGRPRAGPAPSRRPDPGRLGGGLDSAAAGGGWPGSPGSVAGGCETGAVKHWWLSVAVAALAAATLVDSPPADAAPAYAPVNRPGPPLDVPAATLRRSLRCSGVARGGREPILLVPGTTLTPSPNYAWNYEWALVAMRFSFCTVELPENANGDIQVAAQYVVYAVRQAHQLSGAKVQIIGYSQGGMVPRWALRFWPDTRALVDDDVGLDASNHGTEDSQFCNADEVVTPNVGPAASSAVHGGGGRIVNVAVQSICPNDASEHLAMGTYDPLGYALALDALTHDGPADPARIARTVCAAVSARRESSDVRRRLRRVRGLHRPVGRDGPAGRGRARAALLCVGGGMLRRRRALEARRERLPRSTPGRCPRAPPAQSCASPHPWSRSCTRSSPPAHRCAPPRPAPSRPAVSQRIGWLTPKQVARALQALPALAPARAVRSPSPAARAKPQSSLSRCPSARRRLSTASSFQRGDAVGDGHRRWRSACQRRDLIGSPSSRRAWRGLHHFACTQPGGRGQRAQRDGEMPHSLRRPRLSPEYSAWDRPSAARAMTTSAARITPKGATVTRALRTPRYRLAVTVAVRPHAARMEAMPRKKMMESGCCPRPQNGLQRPQRRGSQPAAGIL